MESGNVFNLQDFEQNKIPFKQRSFEDSIDTFLSLFDADLLLIWMNTFRHGFRFRHASCPVLPIVLIFREGSVPRRWSDQQALVLASLGLSTLYLLDLPNCLFSYIELNWFSGTKDLHCSNFLALHAAELKFGLRSWTILYILF